MIDSVVPLYSRTLILCTVRMDRLWYFVWCLITQMFSGGTKSPAVLS